MGSWGTSEQGWRKGPWTPEEDKLLIEYVSQHGEGRWTCVSKSAGLNRSGKSCRLRWVNYLRPGLKKGHITPQEEGIIIELHALWGNKWSTIARYLPGRTDNEIKNYWRTHFKKRKTPDNQDQRRFHKQKQQHKQEYDSKNTEVSSSDQAAEAISDEEKGRKPTETADQNVENNQFLMMSYYDNYPNWLDYYNIIQVDDYLWGGLWNLDDQNGSSKMASQNYQANVGNHSRGGGYIFKEFCNELS